MADGEFAKGGAGDGLVVGRDAGDAAAVERRRGVEIDNRDAPEKAWREMRIAVRALDHAGRNGTVPL